MAFDAISELLRQEALGDLDFFSLQPYYFELLVPTEKSIPGLSSFLIPLVINPDRLELEEPFAMHTEPTLDGGVWVEESGIVMRNLTIKGNTGFDAKPFRGDAVNSIIAPDQGRSYSEKRPKPPPFVPDGLLAFSGQRHFQFLQDVLRTYADLKRDPSTALGTVLNFHNPKDDEHWRVHPRTFMGMREARRATLYDYDIKLVISGPAIDPGATFSEDKNLLDIIKDKIAMIQSAIKLAVGAVRDITNLVNDIENIVRGFGNIINDAIGLIDAATDFVNGVSSLIQAPFDIAASITDRLDTSLTALVNSGRSIPDGVYNSIRKVERSVERLKSFPEAFQTDTQRSLEAARRGQELSTSRTKEQLAAAAEEAPADSFQTYLARGTALSPGDQDIAQSELGIGRGLDQFQSAKEIRVTGGDTLESLAAKYLGDARKWRSIARLNNLTEPYLSRDGYPGTRKIGDRLLIPSFDPPPEARTQPQVLGVAPNTPSDERLLGTDLRLKQLTDRPGDFWDFEVDDEADSADFRSISGVDNLKQALLTRLRTERGTNKMYRNLGRDRVIGMNLPAVDRETILFRIGQAVRADPRVTDLFNLKGEVSADKITVEMDVQIVGASTRQRLDLSF